MPPSPPPPPVVHGGKKAPTTAAAAASGASGHSVGTAHSDNLAATNSVSSFLQGKTFVQKIHTLLTMTKYSSIISWNDAGTAVIIHDVDAFISTIIPAHFKRSKFGSFIRKMRRWGFSVITKKRSTSRTSTSSERGQIAVMEFSSEHFLRDQPELCLLMKDERHVKTQFSFLDRTVRKAHNGAGENPDGVCVHSPLTSSSNSKSQQQSNVSSFAMVPSSKDAGCTGAGGLNATINHGYPHNHAHSNSMPSPMITPHQHQQSFYNTMPMMNMMMPPPPPYPPYGYGAPPLPPQAPGLGFAPSSPPFQSPSAPNGYPPYPYQQQQVMQQYQQQQPQMTSLSPQQQQMMQPHLQQQQQQMMQPYPQQPQQKVQQYQQQHQYQQQYQPQQQQPLEQQNQQCPPPPKDHLNLTTVSSKRGLLTNFAASTTPNGCSDTMASSATGGAAVQLSSSEESTELLPNLDLNMRVYSRLNTEHNEV